MEMEDISEEKDIEKEKVLNAPMVLIGNTLDLYSWIRGSIPRRSSVTDEWPSGL